MHRRNILLIQAAFPDKKDVSLFRRKITRWFKNKGRKYPWRKTSDPFKVLIAEMMLRRTKADQVKPIYKRLLGKYPNVKALANSDSRQLRKILLPLGLKWRIPAFKRVARVVIERFSGKVPITKEELLTLPGVGEYVAGAILTIAYNKKEWIVDSNIVRIFKRYFGIETSKEGRRDKNVIEISKIYASGRNPRKANLGLLDIGALICTPQKPSCNQCPLKKDCNYLRIYGS